MGKDQTVHIERNNGRQRHWFARFRRKSIVVSKSEEMVHATMKLLSGLHVNGGLNRLIEEFHASLLWGCSQIFYILNFREKII